MYSEEQQPLAMGIDLGTTNSCVAVCIDGKVVVIKNEHGNNITPSVVSFTDSGRTIGDTAKVQAQWNAENTVFGVKRLIGRQLDDEAIQEDIRHWPFKVTNDDGKPMVKVNYREEEQTFHPEQISAMVLEKMKAIAEAHLGHEVKDAVITVPAYFDNNQRQATKAAGQIAGLNVLRLMNEPTAAAMAYGLDKMSKEKRNVLVYDLGGGTFDVSILTMEKGVFEVKATKGDTHLGGEDFDSRMVDHFAKEILSKHEKDIFKNKSAVRRLRAACEKVKISLTSSSRVVDEELAHLMDDVHFVPSMKRACFEDLNADLLNGTIETVKSALKDSGLTRSDIHDVVLVGGSTRIPKVQALLKEYFQRQKLNRGINPDEAVACGAAIQAAILSGCRPANMKDIVLYDVVPLSLGIEILGGIMSTIVERNTSIPIRKKETYTTSEEGQTKADIEVYEGERIFVENNNLLGKMVLEGLTPEPRGYCEVDVIFEIDDDCILHVKARDRETGNEKNLQILNNSKRLNTEQMERLVREAEMYRVNDYLAALRIGALNDLELYLQDIKVRLNEPSMQRLITERQRETVLDKVRDIGEWLESDEEKSESDYHSKQAEMENIWNPVITLCMQSSAAPSSSANRPIIHLGD